MSFILDALKKIEQEKRHGGSLPPEDQLQLRASARGPTRRPIWLMLIVAMVSGVVTASVLIYLGGAGGEDVASASSTVAVSESAPPFVQPAAEPESSELAEPVPPRPKATARRQMEAPAAERRLTLPERSAPVAAPESAGDATPMEPKRAVLPPLRAVLEPAPATDPEADPELEEPSPSRRADPMQGADDSEPDESDEPSETVESDEPEESVEPPRTGPLPAMRLVGQEAALLGIGSDRSLPSPDEVGSRPEGVPELVLQGTSVIKGAPVAVVNDQRVFVGDRIEGATVLSIEEREVELEFEGERFKIRL